MFNVKFAATSFREEVTKKEASRPILCIRPHLKLAGAPYRVDEP